MLLLYIWINLCRKCCDINFININIVDVQYEEITRSNWKLYTIYKDLNIKTDEFLLPLFRNVISVERFYMNISKPGNLNFINNNYNKYDYIYI